MSTRTRILTALVAAALCAGGANAQPHAALRGADPACPPSEEGLRLCLGLGAPSRLGRSVDPAEYDFPFRDPYLATMTAGSMNPDGLARGVKHEVLRVPVLPGRNRFALLEGRGDVGVVLYRQPRPARLLFILGGIGSTPYFGLGPYYATLFHELGMHVVVLPSPMSWTFALGASQSGAPGFPPDDARDVYRLMQSTLALLRARHGVEVTDVDFLGASLGALEGAYLSVLDADEGKIGIRRYLLLNPPIDLSYALARLNEWQALGGALGRERAAGVALKARGIVDDYIADRRANPEASFDRAARQFSRFSTEELQFVIAEYVRLGLPELVYVSQAIEEQSLLTAPRDEGRKRLLEAKAFTLKDYTEKIALPRRLDTDAAGAGDEAGSLWAILERVRGNPRVHIMHNVDDVLVERAAVDELKQILGDQMTVYPSGGHLGNLWHPQNRDDILRFFVPFGPGPARTSSPAPASLPRVGAAPPRQ